MNPDRGGYGAREDRRRREKEGRRRRRRVDNYVIHILNSIFACSLLCTRVLWILA